jgi:hypothetical protein
MQCRGDSDARMCRLSMASDGALGTKAQLRPTRHGLARARLPGRPRTATVGDGLVGVTPGRVTPNPTDYAHGEFCEGSVAGAHISAILVCFRGCSSIVRHTRVVARTGPPVASRRVLCRAGGAAGLPTTSGCGQAWDVCGSGPADRPPPGIEARRLHPRSTAPGTAQRSQPPSVLPARQTANARRGSSGGRPSVTCRWG